jgi:hypothetical protein
MMVIGDMQPTVLRRGVNTRRFPGTRRSRRTTVSEQLVQLVVVDQASVLRAEHAILGPPLRCADAPRDEAALQECTLTRLIGLVNPLLSLEFMSATEAVQVTQMTDRAEIARHLVRALRRYDVYYAIQPRLTDKTDWTDDASVARKRKC